MAIARPARSISWHTAVATEEVGAIGIDRDGDADNETEVDGSSSGLLMARPNWPWEFRPKV
jgi:hypothetical protein